MKRVVIGFAVCCCLGGFAGSANAASVTFDFASGLQSGNQLTVGGYTLQVEAFSALYDTGPGLPRAQWVATTFGTAAINSTSSGLGVTSNAHPYAATTPELNATYDGSRYGYQDWLAFKLINPPAGQGASSRYASVTYSGLGTDEFSTAQINTAANDGLDSGTLLHGVRHDGLIDATETLALPDFYNTGNHYLLIGPRLGDGSGDSFRVAAVTMDIAPVPVPGAAWLLGSGLLGLAGLGRRKKAAVA